MKRFILLFFALLSGAWAWPALPLEPLELQVQASFFAGNDTVFYLEDLETGTDVALGGSRYQERHPPFSTFKIPNLLIALELGVAKDLEHPIVYRATHRPKQDFWPADWAQDQTLGSAFQRSAAWAFQDLAQQIGQESYLGYLEHFAYGNQLARGDSFWLDGTLSLSPKEQVDFLRKLLTEQFEIAPLHIDLLREISLNKEKDGFRLYGKTGAGPVQAGDMQGEFEGWFVGWLERPKASPLVFALWTKGPSFTSIKDYRKEASVVALKQAGFLPADW